MVYCASRDLTPFGFLRLDMRPAHAVSIQKGTWAVELELGYQNTWALSEEVEKYLTALESEGRRDFGPAEQQAIHDLPGENYLLDVESAALDVTLHYRFAEHWTGYFIASAISYQGGFLDSTIESFHDTFGFSSFGRPAARRDEVNVIYDLKSTQISTFGSPTDGGFTDPTLGLRFVGFQLQPPWGMSVEAAVKIPVDGERLLLPTGNFDYGIQASLQRRMGNHALYANAAAVYYGGAEFPVPQDSQVIPTLILGYEYRLRSHQHQPAGLHQRERVFAQANRPGRIDRREIPVERRPAPSHATVPDHIRVHRKRAERQQYSGHRLSTRSSVHPQWSLGEATRLIRRSPSAL